MSMLDFFGSDLFGTTTMTAAVNSAPFKPGRIGQLGLFEEQGIATTTVIVDEQQGLLTLVPVSPRGSPGQPQPRPGRSARPFMVPHIQRNRAIMADEVQGVRAFGSEGNVETVQIKRDQYLGMGRNDVEATIEYHRVTAIQGKVLDADGVTVIHDLYSEFGIAQQVVPMALTTASTEIIGKGEDILEGMESALGNVAWSGARAICGKGFWRALITHAKVKEAYLNSTLSASLQNDPRLAFVFAGIAWERYRGGVGNLPFVPDDDAYAYPDGVPGLFITRYAPADYIETVNTLGIPLYSKAVADDMGKSIDIEVQSNPLNICTRPRAVIRLTKV